MPRPRRTRLLIRRLALLAACAAAASVWSAPTAQASARQLSVFQDNVLLLRDASFVHQTMATLHRLGVQRLRVSVLWDAIAPGSSSWQRPNFDAADPAAYPASGWAPYDQVVQEARGFGMGVDFDVMGGAPLWATRRPPSPSMLHVYYPSADEFGRFVRAVGRRYSGSYRPPGATAALPGVTFWSIWNEPNVGSSSLSPQTAGGVEVGPRLYRALADAAYAALRATGHGRDVILAGELASTGHADPGAELGMEPLRFLRALFCVDGSYQPLQGTAAARRGCPTGSRAAFRRAHPVLFDASGWSHHPYDLLAAPDVPPPPADPDWVTLADLGRLESALDRIQRLYGSDRRMPIYLTEYGLETNPPKAEFTITPALQATYINEAEYLAWRDPRVAALSEYLLRDAPSFASGLEFADGTPKPSLGAYRLPIWIPSPRGHAIEVWGCVRPVDATGTQGVAAVQIELDGQPVRSVRPAAGSCYFDLRVVFPHSGAVRLAWRYPDGTAVFSRTVPIQETSGPAPPRSLPTGSAPRRATGSGSGAGAVAGALVLLGLLAVGGMTLRRRRRAEHDPPPV